MIDREKIAHDLALLYVKYRLEIEREETDAAYHEEDVLCMYKSSFNNFLDSLES